jgi:ribokinase
MMDLVVYAPRRPEQGETLKGESFTTTPGGKGFNQAVAASRAGAQTAMLGHLGSDSFGDIFLEALAREGINATGVAINTNVGTGVGFPVVTPGGDNSIIIIPQSNELVDEEYVYRFENLIQKSNVLLLQLELPLPSAKAAAVIAKKSGVTVVLTPSPATSVEALNDFIGLVDVLVPNQIEAAALAISKDSIEEQATFLMKKFGCKGVVITLGLNGAFITDGFSSEVIPAPKVESVDTVGAGDTLCGYLGAQLAVGKDLFEATRYAIYAATLSVTRKGASSAMPQAIEVTSFVQAQTF